MFLRLGHKALVRGDYKQHHVHARGAHQHVLDQLFMPRYVYDARDLPVRQDKFRKAEFNGDTALFFLFQAVNVPARSGVFRQRVGQAGLAVVNMPGGSDNDMLHLVLPTEF